MPDISFLITDGTLDRDSMRVLPEGLDVSKFVENPVMFYNHSRYSESGSGVIGKWDNVRKEGVGSEAKWLADPVFDLEDKTAKEIARKVEKGFLRCCSVGLRVLELSDSPEDILPGQRRMSIKKAELVEVSIVDIPANPNATAQKSYILHFPDKGVSIGSGPIEKSILDACLPELQQTTTPPEIEMKTVIKHFGLPETASEAEVLQKVSELTGELAKKDKTIETQNGTIAELEKQMTDAKAKAVKDSAAMLVGSAVDAGKINKSEEAAYLQLAEGNYDAVKLLLDAKKAYQPIATQLKNAASKADERKIWTLTDWQKKDPEGLKALRTEDPEGYKELIKR
jgi:HK97 family phage prohead protease